MPKKPNYQFEKRQKELDRKARKEEKLRRRLDRATDSDADAAEPASNGPTPNGDANDGAGALPASAPR
jgi:hypothetical protein